MLHENVNFQFPWKWIYVHDMRLLMSHSDAILSLLRFFYIWKLREFIHICLCTDFPEMCDAQKEWKFSISAPMKL